MSALGRILLLWRGRAGWLLLGVVVSLLSLGAAIGVSALSGALVAGGLIGASLTLQALGVARVVLRYLERLTTHSATFRALADLRVWFFRGLSRSAAGGLGFRRAGDALSRLVGDVEALDGLYLRILVPLICAVLVAPVIVVLIGLRDGRLAAIIAVLFGICVVLLPLLAARAVEGAGGRLARASADLRIAALDALTGLREVRAFGAEGRMLAAVQAREQALFGAQREVARGSTLASAAAFLCGQAALLAILASAGVDPVGAVVAILLVTAAFEVAGGLPRAGALAGHAAAAASRVLSAACAAAPVAEPADPVALPPDGGVRFQSVSFRWSPDRPPVFDGLSMDVPAGSRVAVLGPSGAGKSTLAALLLRVASPAAGRVLIGGTDIAGVSTADLRARVAWLSQATHLFDDTIRNNLLLARPGATDAALWAALDAAQVGDVVRALPDMLDAWVGEGGARLSGGQARRIALARALLTEAPILILDEPCAGLDAETERDFLSTLNETAPGRTVILIAHRLTGVENLDRVFRLSAGHAIAATA